MRLYIEHKIRELSTEIIDLSNLTDDELVRHLNQTINKSLNYMFSSGFNDGYEEGYKEGVESQKNT